MKQKNVALLPQNKKYVAINNINHKTNKTCFFDNDPFINSGGGPTGGIAKFDGATWTVYDTSSSSLLANSVGTILIDPCNNVWCGNYYLNKFDGSTWTLYDTTSTALPDENVGIVVEDCEGDVWVGTLNNGIARFTNDCTVLPNCTPPPICSITTSIPNNDESKNSFVLYPNPSN